MGVGSVVRRQEVRGLRGLPKERRGQDSLSRAVHRHRRMSREGLRERLFTLAFRGLVYPQIWEDPLVDMAAMEIEPGQHVVTIASGGCNALSYLIDNPARVTAVDLNRTHVAFNRLKIAALKHLPSYAAFYRFFGEADSKTNLALYKQYIEPHLCARTRGYWNARDLMLRRRIKFFSRNIYRYGLLGTFIGAGHLVARLHGRNPRRMMEAQSLVQQRELFESELAPLFRKGHIRWLINSPVALYGLGIPPSQYRELAACGGGDLAQVLSDRLERLACGFALDDNYFAWQAFARKYPGGGTGALPPYLEQANYETIRSRADRINVRNESFTDFLGRGEGQSVDRYVLLDAQDWMTDENLTSLWREITRTARPGARVIFRTAGERTILPGRVPAEILAYWHYEDERSAELTRQDRSSIYGAFHLYRLCGPQ